MADTLQFPRNAVFFRLDGVLFAHCGKAWYALDVDGFLVGLGREYSEEIARMVQGNEPVPESEFRAEINPHANFPGPLHDAGQG